MLSHLNILLNVIALMAGAGAVIFIFQTYRTHAYPMLKYLLYAVVLYNLIIVIDVTSIYSCVNVMENCLVFRSSLFAQAIGPLSSLFFIMMTYYLIRMMLAVLDKNIKTYVYRIIISGFWIIVSSYAVRIIRFFLQQSSPVIILIQSSLLAAAYIVLLLALVSFVIQGLFEKETRKKKIVIASGLVYFTGFTGLALFGILLDPAVRILIPVIYLLLNWVPYFGIKHLFLPYHTYKSVQHQGEVILDSLCSKYAISKREREITELILLGNSNKEIEYTLFISLSTVKNHIYNLYRKLGVKSRGQLVYFILEFEKR